MTKHLLDTNTVTFGELIGNGKIYRIPLYQRDYSWQEDQWEELWEDILLILQQDSLHYMGSLMLQSRDNRTFTVIDGQQRIATLSVLVIGVIQCLNDLIARQQNEADNQERKEILIRKFLGDKDPTSLKYSSKIFLNANNDGFYQSYLLQFKPPINPSRLNDSEKLLWNAYKYFYERMQKEPAISASGETLSTFLNDVIAERLTFIQITVEDELSAYTVFETLNARGIQLTPTDLLKNYLFSLVSATDIRHVQDQWNRITAIVGLREFPVFLRHFLNSRQKLVRHDRLFKELKITVNTNQAVFALLDQLERSAAIYEALDSPDDPLWAEMPEQERNIRELSLFKVVQAKPLLLSGYEKLPPNEFTKLLHIVLVIAFRYNVIAGLNPKVFEETYNKAAIKIFSGELTSARAIFQELRSVYLPDEAFKSAFSIKQLNTKRQRKIVRYILFAIENQIGGKNYDFEESAATIEHILPENPNEGWNAFFEQDEQENYVYRLGNYSLLEAKLNKRYAANASFEEKKEVYAQSQYHLSRELTQDEWTPHTLKRRQEQLAQYAAAIWKIDY